LAGTLEIRGTSRDHVVEVHTEDLGDSWRMSVESTIRQSDYGIKPYSLLMGSVQVANDVSLSFSAVHAKGD
jgi:polyisoprenoid-binding protein YceI